MQSKLLTHRQTNIAGHSLSKIRVFEYYRVGPGRKSNAAQRSRPVVPATNADL